MDDQAAAPSITSGTLVQTTPEAVEDAAWRDYLAEEVSAEEEVVQRRLTVPQALELARLHVIEGRRADEIAARWPDWSPEQIVRALRSTRFKLAADRLQQESRSLAGRLIARLNIAADETIDRMVRVAQGKEQAGTAVDKDGETVPVPFSDKVQWEAMRWHAEQVLPPKPTANQPGGVTIYNQTNYNAAMQHLSAGLSKMVALFGGGPTAGLPGIAGSGGVTAVPGTVTAGSPPSMNQFLRQGAEQLLQVEDAVVIPTGGDE